MRLRHINAPEVDSLKGQKAKAFVVDRLKNARVVIKTYSTDIYDRYLVDVFYLPGPASPAVGRPAGLKGKIDYAKVASEGILLNQELVDHGLADVWQAHSKDDLAFLR